MKEKLKDRIGDFVKDTIESVSNKFKNEVEKGFKFAMKMITSLIFLLFGFLLFLFGLGKFIEAFFSLHDGIGFVILGLAVMVIGFVVNMFNSK